MAGTGAEVIGGGSPDRRASPDKAPVSPGFIPDDSMPFVDNIAETVELTARLPQELGGCMGEEVYEDEDKE